MPFPAEPTPLAAIRLLSLDVDGVLTDGRVHYGVAGIDVASQQPMAVQSFNIRDGAAIRLLQRAGIPVAIISGRDTPMVRRRCAELDIELAWLGCADKAAAMTELVQASEIEARWIAHVGDDLPDLPAMQVCGHAITVADGHGVLRDLCPTVTRCRGGEGVVAEVAELILRARGDFEALLDIAGLARGDPGAGPAPTGRGR